MLSMVKPIVDFHKYGYVSFVMVMMEVIHVYGKIKERCWLVIPVKWHENNDDKNIEFYPFEIYWSTFKKPITSFFFFFINLVMILYSVIIMK